MFRHEQPIAGFESTASAPSTSGGGVTALGEISKLMALGTVGAWIGAIAAAVGLAIDIVAAMRTPADPIIRDPMSAVDVDRLTSANFPAPRNSFDTGGGGRISVYTAGFIGNFGVPKSLDSVTTCVADRTRNQGPSAHSL